MKRMTFNALFYIMRTRLTRKGEAPILLRVTVNGTRSTCSTHLKVNPNIWNSTAEKAKGRDRRLNELNQHLDAIKAKIAMIHRQLESDNREFDAQTVINLYQGKSDKQKIMLLELFQ